jgi:small subunit ribosomal protein S4
MGRYLGPSCRRCRAVKIKLFLKGEKCHTKCVLDKRKTLPGPRTKRMKKPTEYGKRLMEKQKAKFIAGLTEEQFRNYFIRAQRMPGLTGFNLLTLLELRLDNVVRQLGLTGSMKFARQLIRHGNVLVNGKTARVPAYHVKVGDKVYLAEKLRQNPSILRWRERFMNPPSWLSVDKEKFGGSVVSVPAREEISYPIDETFIVELYSK